VWTIACRICARVFKVAVRYAGVGVAVCHDYAFRLRSPLWKWSTCACVRTTSTQVAKRSNVSKSVNMDPGSDTGNEQNHDNRTKRSYVQTYFPPRCVTWLENAQYRKGDCYAYSTSDISHMRHREKLVLVLSS
jgi:hypothetical protein